MSRPDSDLGVDIGYNAIGNAIIAGNNNTLSSDSSRQSSSKPLRYRPLPISTSVQNLKEWLIALSEEEAHGFLIP